MKKQKGFSIVIQALLVLALVSGIGFLVKDYMDTKKALGAKEAIIKDLNQKVKDQQDDLTMKDNTITELNNYVKKLSEIQTNNERKKEAISKKYREVAASLPKASADDPKCPQSDDERNKAEAREQAVVEMFCIYQPEDCDSATTSTETDQGTKLKQEEEIKNPPSQELAEPSLQSDNPPNTRDNGEAK